MSDTVMAISAIFIATILMFIFPIMEIAGENDEISQTLVEVAVADFVDAVATKGKITPDDYNNLKQKLYATGNSFSIEMEVKIIDDNPRRATTTGSRYLNGEYQYYSVYTNSIMEYINKNEEYLLKKDDQIIVTAKNTNITVATQLKNMFYKLIGANTYTIGASSTALIVNPGRAQ